MYIICLRSTHNYTLTITRAKTWEKRESKRTRVKEIRPSHKSTKPPPCALRLHRLPLPLMQPPRRASHCGLPSINPMTESVGNDLGYRLGSLLTILHPSLDHILAVIDCLLLYRSQNQHRPDRVFDEPSTNCYPDAWVIRWPLQEKCQINTNDCRWLEEYMVLVRKHKLSLMLLLR